MIRKIYALLLLLFNLQMFGCTTFKQIEKVERLEYSNSYLITVTVFPKGKGHLLIMNGVGDENHLSSFSKESIDDFFRSFYAIYAYSPLIVDLESSYKDFVHCYGYDITWYNRYYINDLINKPESVYEIKLEDEFNVKVEFYRLLNDIEIKYIDQNIKHCLYDISLEIDFNKKESFVKRVALFLDKS